MCIHVYQIIKNWGPSPYNSLRHADNRKYFLGLSVTRNRREAHMYHLAREVGKIWRCLYLEKGNLISEFKYGQTWKIWPSLLSLSIYSTFKNVEKGVRLKTTALLVFFLWLVKSNIINTLVDHLEKCGLFSNFQYGFRSSQSTADLLTVVSGRIARTFHIFWGYSSCSTWYVQDFQKCLKCCSSPQT